MKKLAQRLKAPGLRLLSVAATGMLFIGLILLSNVSVSNGETQRITERVIFDFADLDKAGNWMIVNDGVMGGVSQSQLVLTPNGTVMFRGNLSLENFGGFASVRSYPTDLQLSAYDGLVIRVKGDGQQYKLRLRTGNNFDGIAYEAAFKTKNAQWLELKIPFSDTVPVYRGYVIADAPELSGGDIAQIGFMISDKQVGPFELEIASIKAYRQLDQTPVFNQIWRGAIPW